jgi:molybdopterin molybdotransferase
MTGAPIPPGADAVVEVEETRLEGLPAGQAGTTVKIFREIGTGKNIRKRGENVQVGDKVLAQGTHLGAPEIGLLALLGKSCIPVYRQPMVTILATGDELADLDEQPQEGQIYNSNSYALWAQVQEAGAMPRLLGIVRDNKEVFRERLKMGLSALGGSDIILISGAVSVGKYDFAREVMEELGVKIRFWTVAMRPGHPLVFGTHNSILVFGLPGNPVSTMIAFEEFVRPVLLKMQGRRDIYPPVVDAILIEPFRNRSGRTHFVRATVEYQDGKYQVRPAGPQGSGILMSMVKANSLMVLPADCEKIEAGETVKVQLLGSRWGWREDPGY